MAKKSKVRNRHKRERRFGARVAAIGSQIVEADRKATEDRRWMSGRFARDGEPLTLPEARVISFPARESIQVVDRVVRERVVTDGTNQAVEYYIETDEDGNAIPYHIAVPTERVKLVARAERPIEPDESWRPAVDAMGIWPRKNWNRQLVLEWLALALQIQRRMPAASDAPALAASSAPVADFDAPVRPTATEITVLDRVLPRFLMLLADSRGRVAETKRKAITLYASGYALRAIATRLGIRSAETAKRWALEAADEIALALTQGR